MSSEATIVDSHSIWDVVEHPHGAWNDDEDVPAEIISLLAKFKGYRSLLGSMLGMFTAGAAIILGIPVGSKFRAGGLDGTDEFLSIHESGMFVWDIFRRKYDKVLFKEKSDKPGITWIPGSRTSTHVTWDGSIHITRDGSKIVLLSGNRLRTYTRTGRAEFTRMISVQLPRGKWRFPSCSPCARYICSKREEIGGNYTYIIDVNHPEAPIPVEGGSRIDKVLRADTDNPQVVGDMEIVSMGTKESAPAYTFPDYADRDGGFIFLDTFIPGFSSPDLIVHFECPDEPEISHIAVYQVKADRSCPLLGRLLCRTHIVGLKFFIARWRREGQVEVVTFFDNREKSWDWDDGIFYFNIMGDLPCPLYGYQVFWLDCGKEEPVARKDYFEPPEIAHTSPQHAYFLSTVPNRALLVTVSGDLYLINTSII